MFQIEKDLPVPDVISGRRAKYPWRRMEVGDSFFTPETSRSGLSGAKRHAEKATGFKFTCSTRVENGIKGVRVWRVE
jgi:hypothetical protein